ncbi:hypothetical protein AVEN_171671-1 [Araneus ventricosus]|uniref:Uncharacterized protein n=1 Tax=Araneus ventricosus TaxID=182803 RepID=A0A4Y2G2A4_ARAVE|nr:hypothetical protein AVEN_171671-1 [Araneus ventricosus]
MFIVFIHRVSTTIRTSQSMSLLDESRLKEHGERYATVITDDRGNALRSSMRDREQLLFAARVDIDVYDASGNIVHIAGKSQFPML